MKFSPWIAAVAGVAVLASSLPAAAQVVRFDPSVKDTASPLVTDVQFRGGGFRRFHGGGIGRGGFGHRGGYGGRYGYRGGYRGGGRGIGIGAGVAGLAAGALIGGAIASQAAPAYGYGYGDPGYAPVVPAGDPTAYCSQRFKSYDPSSGTYLGYDGARHPCP